MAGGVKSRLTTAAFQLAQADAARHARWRLPAFLAGAGARSALAAVRPAPVFELQFNLAEAQGLAGFQNAFGDFFVVDERAVGGIQVPDDHLVAAQQNFAVMAGNGRLGDLKRVILHATDGGAIHFNSCARPVMPCVRITSLAIA